MGSAQRGSSLIEVLVAVVVVSIGMLGLAGLYNYAVQANKSAITRTAASMLVQDYAELVRANPDGFSNPAPAPNYDNDIGNSYDPTATNIPAMPTTLCVFPNCTVATLATRDKAQFLRRLRAALPAGDFAAARVPNTNQMNIWIVWVEGKGSTGAANSNAENLSDSCPQQIVNRAAALNPYPRCFYARVAL